MELTYVERVNFRHNIPGMPNIKRVRCERGEEANRAHFEEARAWKVLGQVPGRHGVRMTQARGEGAVSVHAHAGEGPAPGERQGACQFSRDCTCSAPFTIYDARLDLPDFSLS